MSKKPRIAGAFFMFDSAVFTEGIYQKALKILEVINQVAVASNNNLAG